MIMSGIAVIFGFVLCALAFQANVRFQNENRLPMQWWLTGEVTWSAPRVLALAFVPVSAIFVLTIYVAMALTKPPRIGQEALVLPILFVLGAGFIALQLAHLWLIARTLQRNGK